MNEAGPESLLTRLNERLDRAERLSLGESAALHGFDREIKQLCTQILDLPEAEGKPYASALEALHVRLERLQAGPNPAGPSPRAGTRQASNAYRQASGAALPKDS